MTRIIATFDNFVKAKPDTQYFWFYDLESEHHDRAEDFAQFHRMYVGNNNVMQDSFNFINIRQIPVNTPYNICLKATIEGWRLRNVLQQIKDNKIDSLGYQGSVPYNDYSRVLRDSENGLVDWFIDDIAEVFVNEIAFDRDLQRALGIPDKPHKLHILCGAYRNEAIEDVEKITGVRVHNANPFEKWISLERANTFTQQIISDIESGVERPYSSLIYNRVPRASRALLLDSMKQSGSLSKSYYSWGIDYLRSVYKGFPGGLKQFVVQGPTNFSFKGRRTIFHYIDDPGRERLNEIFDTWYGENVQPVYFPDEIDKITLTENQAHRTNMLHPKLCNFKVITETVYSQYTFLTEKTFKAIQTFMPFVVFGNPQTIENLERLGYNTYGKWIDHSYDKIWEFTPRLQALTKEIDRLSNLSPEDWAQMRLEMLPSMIYNYQHLLNNYDRTYGHVWYE